MTSAQQSGQTARYPSSLSNASNNCQLPSLKDLNFYRPPQRAQDVLNSAGSSDLTGSPQDIANRHAVWRVNGSNISQPAKVPQPQNIQHPQLAHHQHTPPLSAGHEIQQPIDYLSKHENSGYAHPNMHLSGQVPPMPGSMNSGQALRSDDPALPSSHSKRSRSNVANMNMHDARNTHTSQNSYPVHYYTNSRPLPSGSPFSQVSPSLSVPPSHPNPAPAPHEQMTHQPAPVHSHHSYGYQQPPQYIQPRPPTMNPQHHPHQSSQTNVYPSPISHSHAPGPRVTTSAPPLQGPWAQQQHHQHPSHLPQHAHQPQMPGPSHHVLHIHHPASVPSASITHSQLSSQQPPPPPMQQQHQQHHNLHSHQQHHSHSLPSQQDQQHAHPTRPPHLSHQHAQPPQQMSQPFPPPPLPSQQQPLQQPMPHHQSQLHHQGHAASNQVSMTQVHLPFARQGSTAIVTSHVEARAVYAPSNVDRLSMARSEKMAEIVNHCTILYTFATRYAQLQSTIPHAQPSAAELEEMSQRAIAVVRLLEEFRRMNLSEAERAKISNDTAGASSEDSRPPKRPWEEVSQGNSGAIGETGSFLESQFAISNSNEKNQTTAEQDMEIIRTKRATSAAGGNGSSGQPKSKYRKRSRATPPGKCHSCNIRETPEWRRGPDGARTLCNACGLHYAKLMRKRDKAGVSGDMPRIDMETLRASARAADLADKSSSRTKSAKSMQSNETTSPPNSAKMTAQHHQGSFQVTTLVSPESFPSSDQNHMPPPPPPSSQQMHRPINGNLGSIPVPSSWVTSPAPAPASAGRGFAHEHLQHQSFMRSSQQQSLNYGSTR